MNQLMKLVGQPGIRTRKVMCSLKDNLLKIVDIIAWCIVWPKIRYWIRIITRMRDQSTNGWNREIFQRNSLLKRQWRGMLVLFWHQISHKVRVDCLKYLILSAISRQIKRREVLGRNIWDLKMQIRSKMNKERRLWEEIQTQTDHP